MNEEEKQAVVLLKALVTMEKKCKIEEVPYKSEVKKIRITLLPEDYGKFEKILNLIEKLQEENKQKSKIIDLMSKTINKAYFESDNFEKWFENKICKIQRYEDYTYLEKNIQQYFEDKVKRKE